MAKERTAQTIAPVTKVLTVHRSVEHAFRIFTDQMGSCWPLEGHSMSGEEAVSCGMDKGVGGHIFESLADGSRVPWGEILVWEPPHRLAFTWQLSRTPEQAQNIEVTFVATQAGTRVELVHSGWEKLGAEAIEVRAGYDSGWEVVFVDRYGGQLAQGV